MQLFIDSADIADIRAAVALGFCDGVTTNPSLIAKSGRSLQEVVQDLAGLVAGPISAECLETESDAMIAEGKKLASWHPQVVVKVPLTPAGLCCVRALSADGIRTNVTLCFSVGQGLLAAKAGATFISPFIGRLDDCGHDGMHLIRELVQLYRTHGFPTQVLAASIRHPRHVIEAAMAGAQAATLPVKILRQLFEHPLTHLGNAQFLADAARTRQS